MSVKGWTPCKHYDKCIGYCPQCLAEQPEASEPQMVIRMTNDDAKDLFNRLTQVSDQMKSLVEKIIHP